MLKRSRPRERKSDVRVHFGAFGIMRKTFIMCVNIGWSFYSSFIARRNYIFKFIWTWLIYTRIFVDWKFSRKLLTVVFFLSFFANKIQNNFVSRIETSFIVDLVMKITSYLRIYISFKAIYLRVWKTEKFTSAWRILNKSADESSEKSETTDLPRSRESYYFTSESRQLQNYGRLDLHRSSIDHSGISWRETVT